MFKYHLNGYEKLGSLTPFIAERGETFIIIFLFSNGTKQTNYEDICIYCFSSFNGLLEIQVDAQTIY